jgi:hypothetical protein
MDAAFSRMSVRDRDDAPADAQPGDSVASSRRKAASYLRAAKLTDNPAERRELRRKAAELLDPRRNRPSGLQRGDDSVR